MRVPSIVVIFVSLPIFLHTREQESKLWAKNIEAERPLPEIPHRRTFAVAAVVCILSFARARRSPSPAWRMHLLSFGSAAVGSPSSKLRLYRSSWLARHRRQRPPAWGRCWLGVARSWPLLLLLLSRGGAGSAGGERGGLQERHQQLR
nr:unnamed protein product [Digitaria exilis]